MKPGEKSVSVILPGEKYDAFKAVSDSYERPVGFILRQSIDAYFFLHKIGLVDKGGSIDLSKLEELIGSDK